MTRLIVVADPRVNDGLLTLIPLEDADEGPVSREAEGRAIEQAVKLQTTTGRTFPSFTSVEEAVRASRTRSAEEPTRPSRRLPAKMVAGPGAPTPARPRPAPAPEPSPGRIPLAEFLRRRLGPIASEGPGDLRQQRAGIERQKRHDPAGVSRLLEGLRAPLFPLPGAYRVGVDRLTDAEPVHSQFESWNSLVPPLGPRAGELVTPRESDNMSEIERIMEEMRSKWGVGVARGESG